MSNFKLIDETILYGWEDREKGLLWTHPLTTDTANVIADAAKTLGLDDAESKRRIVLVAHTKGKELIRNRFDKRSSGLYDSDFHVENYNVMRKVAKWIELNLPESSKAEVTFGCSSSGNRQSLDMRIWLRNRWTHASCSAGMPMTDSCKVTYTTRFKGKEFHRDFRGDWNELYDHIIYHLSTLEVMRQTKPIVPVSMCDCCGGSK